MTLKKCSMPSVFTARVLLRLCLFALPLLSNLHGALPPWLARHPPPARVLSGLPNTLVSLPQKPSRPGPSRAWHPCFSPDGLGLF